MANSNQHGNNISAGDILAVILLYAAICLVLVTFWNYFLYPVFDLKSLTFQNVLSGSLGIEFLIVIYAAFKKGK